MSTASEVKSGLDEISNEIRDVREIMKKVKSNAVIASAALAELATTYADVVSTINAYGTTNAFEALSKAELAKMVSEYTALKALADQVSTINLG